MDYTGEAPQGEAIDTHTEKDGSAIIPLSNTRLTWGVELEFVFAFHESQLELSPVVLLDGASHLSTPHKNLPYKFRRDTNGFKNEIPSVVLPNRVYNSWGVYNKHRLSNKKTIPYQWQVHNILDKVLDEKCSTINHHIEMAHSIDEKEEIMYNEWLIMREHSVCGVGSQNIPTWLPRVQSTTNWDSYGLELVSPIFGTDSNQGFNEIAQILEATKGTSSELTGAFITNQCGLHVHIQAPTDLQVLKELAVLTIVYESEISKLHPQCRRPEHLNARYNIESNRLRFLHTDKERRARHTYGDLDVSNTELARQPDDFLDTIRQQINNCSDAKELALLMNWPNHGLGNELGNRSRQVNFTAAARPKAAPYTIEFRQARGTLNATDVRKWVEFCIGLVRVAQFYVDNPGRFPMKSFKGFLVDGNEESVTERFYILDLMWDMGMSEEDKSYWRTRMARFAGKGGRLDRLDNEKEPEEGQEGQGIPGDGGGGDSDDPGEGPSGGDGQGDNSGSGSSGGSNSRGNNSEGNNSEGNNSEGNNGGSSGGSDAPQPPPPDQGMKLPPKTGDKRPTGDDEEDDEDQKEPGSKKQKMNGGGSSDSKGNSSSIDQPGGDSTRGDKSERSDPGGNKHSPRTGDKRPVGGDDDDEDHDGQQKPDSKRQRKESLTEGGEDEDKSGANHWLPLPQTNLARMATTLAVVLGSIAPFMAALFVSAAPAAPTLSEPPLDDEAPPSASALVIPPDFGRPTEGMIAPIGSMSPDEAHVFLSSVWAVKDFDKRWWMAKWTDTNIQTPTGTRNFVCAINAIRQSMRDQYPDSPYGEIEAHELLALFDRLVGRMVCNDEDDQELAMVVDRWTGGEYQIVVVPDALNDNIAHRGGFLSQYPQQHLFGRNLYVHHQVAKNGKGGGHWESMFRRETRRGG